MSAASRPARFRTSVAVPSTVRLAVWLLVLTIAARLFAAFAAILTTNWDAYVAEFTVAFVEQGGAEADAASLATTSAITSYASFAIAQVAILVLALLLPRGAGWIRIVVSVVGALSIATSLGSNDVFATIVSVVLLLALILLWVPSANAFFTGVATERRAFRAKR